MFKKIDQEMTNEYQNILNSDEPFLSGHCNSWGLGEGVFRFETENVTLITMDRDGNYRCYSMSVNK